MKFFKCLSFLLGIHFSLFSQSHNTKAVQENLTCISPPGATECMIFYKEDLKLDGNNTVLEGRLGKGYSMERPLVVLELGNNK